MNKQVLKITTSLVLMTMLSVALAYTLGGSILLYGVGLFVLGMAKGFLFPSFEMPKNLAYDGFVITDTTYAGEAAAGFITKAITGNDTVQGGHVFIQENIKYKYTIPRWDMAYTDLIQDRQATPVSKGNQNIDGRALIPADYMIYHEFNPREFEQHWQATQLQGALIDTRLPVTTESVIAQEVIKRHDRYGNKSFWNNTTLSTGVHKYYDGFIRKAFTGSGTILPASPTTLTNANIAGEFQKGVDLLPSALKYDTMMKIYCSYGSYDLYAQYQRNQANKGIDITEFGVKRFNGLTVVPIADFPDNTYMIARGTADRTSNLWVGLNSLEDASLKISPVQANSENWFIKMLMKVDVQIGWLEETVYYGGTPSTNP
jgi:hypothetical protein